MEPMRFGKGKQLELVAKHEVSDVRKMEKALVQTARAERSLAKRVVELEKRVNELEYVILDAIGTFSSYDERTRWEELWLQRAKALFPKGD